MKILLSIAALASIAFSAGCATSPATNTNQPSAGNTATSNTTANANPAPKADDVPASIKAVFPTAQTFTTQHKDLTDAQIASIEKDTSSKVGEKDHHSYLAFSTTGGTRTQIGAATIVKAAGKEVIVVYENKDGSPMIKEIKAEGLPAPFLSQFVGKGHDDDLLLGVDIKANGANEEQAKAITEAVRVDVLAMQALYGRAHAH